MTVRRPLANGMDRSLFTTAEHKEILRRAEAERIREAARTATRRERKEQHLPATTTMEAML